MVQIVADYFSYYQDSCRVKEKICDYLFYFRFTPMRGHLPLPAHPATLHAKLRAKCIAKCIAKRILGIYILYSLEYT